MLNKLVACGFNGNESHVTNSGYGICRDAMGQLAGAYPQSVNVTPEERESIERVNLAIAFFDGLAEPLYTREEFSSRCLVQLVYA